MVLQTISRKKGSSFLERLILASYYTSDIFCVAAIYFPVTIVMLVMEIILQMRLEMEKLLSHHPFLLFSTDVQIETNLKKWTRRYGMLTELVETINQCFGDLFLQSLIFLCFSFVIETFYIYISIVIVQEPIFSLFLGYSLIKFVAFLVVFGYYPSRIKEEVEFFLEY